MLSWGKCISKIADRRKNPWCTRTASNLQPSDLCSNAYRNLPGDQDIFSLLFSCIYIHRKPREWLFILKHFLWNLMDIVLFNKALQYKCWRSVGHQVLQPAKDVELRTVYLKSFRQEKKSMMHQDSLEPAAIRFSYTCLCIFTSWHAIV